MVDIHIHCIPGVDDGSRDFDMSVEMLRMAYEQGVREIICTSHNSAYEYDSKKVLEGFEKIKSWCNTELPELQLYLGCEINCAPEHMETIIERLQNKQYPTMNGTAYVLTEYWSQTFEEMKECVRILQNNGYKVIVAHVERYKYMITQISQVKELKEMGCFVQINAYSIALENNLQIKKLANEVLKEELADFLGSDAHRMNHRPPMVARGIQEIHQKCSEAYADALCYGNAKKYLDIK